MDKARRSSGGGTDDTNDLTKVPKDGLSDGKQRKEEMAKKSKSRKSNMPQIEWAFKIYVLSTSGILLQYAGDGAYNRLPEKMLQLGKNSAAFASDVIPGKRWVLQVLQESTEDGTAATKSVFSRLGFNGGLKKSTSSFLLVLESAEEMDAWLVAVRKEIEALGGKKYRPDIGVRKTTDEIVQQLQEKPSRRYLIKRDPSLYSNPRNSQSLSVDGYDPNNKENDVATGKENDTHPKRANMSSWHSAAASSTTQTTVSTDQAVLDRLRESRRTSYASTDVKTTYATSCDDSPASSPVTTTTKIHPLANEGTANGRLLPSADAANRRKSFQTLAMGSYDQKRPLDLPGLPANPRPRSINSTSQLRSPSPAVITPNFSAPSFSKRYSQSHQSTPVPVPHIVPVLPTDRSSLPDPSSRPERSELPERPESVVGELPSSHHTPPKPSRSRPSNSEIPSTITLSATNKDTFQPYLSSNAFPSDPVTRRFSSLEYSTIPPTHSPARHSHSPAPHPPPTSALPALPPGDISFRPSSTPAPTFRKLRRPASMQVRSETAPKIRSMKSQSTLPTSGAAALLYPKKKALRSSLMGPSKGVQNMEMEIPVVKVEGATPEMVYGWAAQVDAPYETKVF
jgi:hypothetical protein